MSSVTETVLQMATDVSSMKQCVAVNSGSPCVHLISMQLVVMFAIRLACSEST